MLHVGEWACLLKSTKVSDGEEVFVEWSQTLVVQAISTHGPG
jgi:hypothetical protein